MPRTRLRPARVRRPVYPARAAVSALLAMSLAGCLLGVQDASEAPRTRVVDDVLVTRMGRVLDSAADVREMLEASTRPIALIHWLDNDSLFSGTYRATPMEVTASWPEYVIHFRSPEEATPGVTWYGERREYRVGLLALAHDGDGDGRAFGWGGLREPDSLHPALPDSLQAEYQAFESAAHYARTCPTYECKRARADSLEAWADRLDTTGLEHGFRAAKRRGLGVDWYLTDFQSVLVIWIPTRVALIQAKARFSRECGGEAERLRMGYNFRLIDRGFPRWQENNVFDRPAPDSASRLVFAADFEDRSDRSLAGPCGFDTWSHGGFRTRLFRARPPRFQNGPDDTDWH